MSPVTVAPPVPTGVDPAWWNAFTQEHGGQTPIDFYGGDLNQALADRAWGAQAAPNTRPDWQQHQRWKDANPGWRATSPPVVGMSAAPVTLPMTGAAASSPTDWGMGGSLATPPPSSGGLAAPTAGYGVDPLTYGTVMGGLAGAGGIAPSYAAAMSGTSVTPPNIMSATLRGATAGAVNQGAAAGYGSTSGAPTGVDPAWWNAFIREHGGQTPLDVYHGDLDHALSDKAWGEQFYAQYKRPPSLYDWKASYGARQADYYGGGGGGGGGGGYGGGGGAAASGELPAYYTSWFTNQFGATPEAYYTPARGGAAQAAFDYQALNNAWLNRTGRYLQPNEMQTLLANASAYLRTRGVVTPTFADILNYASQVVDNTPTPPAVTPLQMGNQ